ncbi:unnamed protein product [Prorocentrum cordatum]|uniref:Uncharacterized protein n=1 Tax=Prorocentrum cordatum TaxID=2364126 RepID=A0ABN9RPG0_9DINO|nr:unnamed protein product [Polarella glacialis]
MPFAAGCLATRAGPGVDAVAWEYHMFHDARCEGVHFLRETSAMERRPLVFGFSDTGLFFEGDALSVGVNGRAAARDRLLQHGTEFGTGKRWRPNEWYATEAFVSSSEIEAWRQWASSEGLKFDADKLGRMPTHKQRQHLETTGAARQFIDAGLGFYTLVTSAATPHAVGDAWYQVREKVLSINWHPGPLGHQLIAAQLGHFVLTQLRTLLGVAPPRLLAERAAHSGPNPVVNEGGPAQADRDSTCGSLSVLSCATGLEPRPPGSDLALLRAPESEDSWASTLSRQASEGKVKSIDQRYVLSGSQDDGELLFAVDVPQGTEEAYALFCAAPCGWFCKGATGYVASVSQRWWLETVAQGLQRSSIGKGPHGEALSNDDILNKIGYHGQYTRENVSDVAFSIDGQEVPEDTLVEVHKRLFGAPGGLYCAGCKSAADLCQPVGRLRPGRQLLGLRVRPRTFSAPDMGVEVLQMMLLGQRGREPGDGEPAAAPRGEEASPEARSPGVASAKATATEAAAPEATAPQAQGAVPGAVPPEAEVPKAGRVAAALAGMEAFWPGGRGREILGLATSKIPAPDRGARLRERLRARLNGKETFVFVAFGSSVTAGHDNYPAARGL